MKQKKKNPQGWSGSAVIARPAARPPTGPRCLAAAARPPVSADYSFALGTSCSAVASALSVTSPVSLARPKKMTWTVRSSLDGAPS